MSLRIKRFSSTLKHIVADILLNEISDPGLKFISLTEVLVSDNLKKARIFVFCPKNNYQTILKELDKAKGFIKKKIAKKMYLRYVPELEFCKDTGFDLDEKILKTHGKEYEKEDS